MVRAPFGDTGDPSLREVGVVRWTRRAGARSRGAGVRPGCDRREWVIGVSTMMGVSIRGMDDGSQLGAGSREPGAGSREPGAGIACAVRVGALRRHRLPRLTTRAADAMSGADCARRERPSRRLSLRPRRPAGPASSRSFVSRVLHLPTRRESAGGAAPRRRGLLLPFPRHRRELVSNTGQTQLSLDRFVKWSDESSECVHHGRQPPWIYPDRRRPDSWRSAYGRRHHGHDSGQLLGQSRNSPRRP